MGLLLSEVRKGKRLVRLRGLHKYVLTNGLGFALLFGLVFAFVWRKNIRRKLQITGQTLCILLFWFVGCLCKYNNLML
jgi:hypothetical protein